MKYSCQCGHFARVELGSELLVAQIHIRLVQIHPGWWLALEFWRKKFWKPTEFSEYFSPSHQVKAEHYAKALSISRIFYAWHSARITNPITNNSSIGNFLFRWEIYFQPKSWSRFFTLFALSLVESIIFLSFSNSCSVILSHCWRQFSLESIKSSFRIHRSQFYFSRSDYTTKKLHE